MVGRLGSGRMSIPAAVRARDLVGYGRRPPAFEWPDGAQVVVNLVLVYEEGTEYSVAWGRRPQRRLGRVRRSRRAAAAARSRHRVALRVRQPGGRLAAGPHLRRGGRAGDRVGGGRGARAEPGRRRVDARARPRPDGPRLALDRGLDVQPRGGAGRRSRVRSRPSSACSAAGPSGWNSRSWPSENTRELLRELGGFLYHSEGSADDVPYYETGDGGPILVVPYSKTYNDARYLMNPGFASPRDFLDTAVMGLDELVREGSERRDDDDGRRARALERPGREGGRLRRVHRARAVRSPGSASCGAATSPAGGSSTTRRHELPPQSPMTPLRARHRRRRPDRRVPRPGDRHGRRTCELVAVCDLDRERAEAMAGPRGAVAYVELAGDARGRGARRCCGCARRRCTTAARPSRRSRRASTSISRSRSPARWRTPRRSSVRPARRPASARSATSGTPAGCSRRPGRRSPASGSGCWWAATSDRRRPGRGSSTGSRGVARSWSGRATTSTCSGRSPARSPPSRRSRRAFACPGLSDSSIDDAIALVLHFQSGALGTIHSVWSADGQPGRYSLDLLGEKATITLRPRPRRPSDQRRLQRSGDRRRIWGSDGAVDRPFPGRGASGATGRWSPARPTMPCATLAVALACERRSGGRRADLAVTVRRIAQSLPGEQRQPDGVRLDAPEAAAAIVGRRSRAPLVAVTYSVEPSKMQLVACSPRSISSSDLAVVREDGHAVRDRRADEQRVRPRQTPCRRGTWSSLSWAKDGRPAVVPAADPVRHATPSSTGGPGAVEGDAVRIHLRPLDQRSRRPARVEREQPARRGHVDPRSSCSVPESVNQSRPSGPNARSFGAASVWPAISEERSSTRPSGVHPLDTADGARVAAPGHVPALGHVDGAVASQRQPPRRAPGDREALERAPSCHRSSSPVLPSQKTTAPSAMTAGPSAKPMFEASRVPCTGVTPFR